MEESIHGQEEDCTQALATCAYLYHCMRDFCRFELSEIIIIGARDRLNDGIAFLSICSRRYLMFVTFGLLLSRVEDTQLLVDTGSRFQVRGGQSSNDAIFSLS